MEAVARVFDPPEIDTNRLLAVSVVGLVINLIGVLFFHDAHHQHCAHHCHHHGNSKDDQHSHDHDDAGSLWHSHSMHRPTDHLEQHIHGIMS